MHSHSTRIFIFFRPFNMPQTLKKTTKTKKNAIQIHMSLSSWHAKAFANWRSVDNSVQHSGLIWIGSNHWVNASYLMSVPLYLNDSCAKSPSPILCIWSREKIDSYFFHLFYYISILAIRYWNQWVNFATTNQLKIEYKQLTNIWLARPLCATDGTTEVNVSEVCNNT